jgi:hypothetical protein
MRLKIGAALLTLAFSIPVAGSQTPRQPQLPPPQHRTHPPPQTQSVPKINKCSLAACINQGVSQGYPHVGALNWCQANKNGC